jgi:small conductance mechanosensitive channel
MGMGVHRQFRKNLISYRRWLSLEVLVIILGIAIIFVTLYFSGRNTFPFLTTYRDYIISAEAAIVSILLVENIGRIIVYRFREHGALAYGVYIRTIIRIVGYLVAVVAIISVLAANPALAISIGTITGVVIGFASQNITSNVLAAALIVATRIVRAGDTITVAGNTGRIEDITLIYTIIEAETGRVFIPNSMMVTNAVQRRKVPTATK